MPLARLRSWLPLAVMLGAACNPAGPGDPAAPGDSAGSADLPAAFTGAAQPDGVGDAPRVLYPFDGALMPPNLLQLKVEWRAPAGQRAFRLTIEDERGPLERAYLACADGCSLPIADDVWRRVADGHRGGAVTLRLQGSAGPGQPVYGSAITVRFAPEDLRGGVYYFSPTAEGVLRVPVGASRPVPFLTSGCAGCHAVSRDGRQVAAAFGSAQTTVGAGVVAGDDPKRLRFPLNPATAWNFSSFSPNGELLVTNWNGGLAVRESPSGRVLATVPPAFIGGLGAAMPDWSPDGRAIAFVRVTAPSQYDYALRDSGDIAILPYNNGAFGPATTLVCARAGQRAHYWPSWSPDSRALVFNTEDCDARDGCRQYDAQATRLRLVRVLGADGTPVSGVRCASDLAGEVPGVVELTAGTHQPHQATNWPRFAPLAQQGRLAFVVSSAKYPFGLTPASGRSQLFLFAVDLQSAAPDPSFPPVWLPFQDPQTSNHGAVFTTDVACSAAADCPAGFSCQAGVCAPVLE